MIGEDDIVLMQKNLGSAPAYNPMDSQRSETQQIREWQQWSAQKLFLDTLRTTLRHRAVVASEDERKRKTEAERASATVRRKGLQIR